MRLHPFRALRPVPDLAERVASVPYDVVNRSEAAALAAGNPYSFLHVGRSDIDLPADVDPYDPRIYATARAALDRFQADGTLLREAEPSLYLYRQIMDGRAQVGVVGCVHIDDYDRDVIRKHEKTRPDKEDDRTRHVLTLRANAEPVFLTYRGRPDIQALATRILEDAPLYDFTAPDGVRHTVWRVPDPRSLVEAFRQVPLAYVADGHHRSASAWRAGASSGTSRRSAGARANTTGSWRCSFRPMSCAFSRTTASCATRAAWASPSCSGGCAHVGRVTVTDDPVPSKSGTLLLLPHERVVPAGAGRGVDRPVRSIASLDVSLLQDRVLGPVLGIGDPRTDKRLDFVGGIRGTAELEQRVRSGEMVIAFSLYPTTLEQLMAVADAGQVMPPKSTWFEPKLRSGLFVHTL